VRVYLKQEQSRPFEWLTSSYYSYLDKELNNQDVTNLFVSIRRQILKVHFLDKNDRSEKSSEVCWWPWHKNFIFLPPPLSLYLSPYPTISRVEVITICQSLGDIQIICDTLWGGVRAATRGGRGLAKVSLNIFYKILNHLLYLTCFFEGKSLVFWKIKKSSHKGGRAKKCHVLFEWPFSC